MNTLWYTDGTDREQFEGRKDIPCHMAVLEEDYRALIGRVMDMSECVRYYDLKNKPEGYWRELFRYQPLAILSEIERIDIPSLENHFLKAGRRKPQLMLEMTRKLANLLDDWEVRLVHYPQLKLSVELSSRVKSSIPTGKGELKRMFYTLLEILRKLQLNYGQYLQEIRACEKNDPGMALLDIFLRYYEEIAGRFNARWQEWPDFYFREILHASCRGIVPDHIWLAFTSVPGAGGVRIEKGTAFVAGKGREGMPVCYKSVEDVVVGDIKLMHLYTYFLEKDEVRFPAARLNFVTGVFQNTIEVEKTGLPQKLSGGKYEAQQDLGLMVCDPMFLLREGKRKLIISFYLIEEGFGYWKEIVGKISEGEKPGETEKKLLKDAFLLDVTTGNGWEKIPEYVVAVREGKCIHLIFYLDKEFAPTVAADILLHGLQTQWPVLRIRMNPAAWLFPYSWMTAVRCYRMKLRVEVNGASALKIYSGIGEVDASTPFYPFGIQPLQGAQLIFGNYEMAVKPLQGVKLHCKWLQLPTGPEGFYGHYRGYARQIDNYSFRVRTEWLKGKKWETDGSGSQYLFGPATDGHLTATGSLPENSQINWYPEGNMPLFRGQEEQYVYGRSPSGFFRMVLDGPEMGFGHAVYQSLFSELMIANARRRHPLPAPALPVSPLLESVEVDYVAEEEICFAPGQSRGDGRLFYLDSVGSGIKPVKPDRPFYLAERLGKTGCLLFGFTKAIGIDRIRFFVDIAPMRREIDVRDGGEADGLWVWNIRQKENWIRLSQDALVQDGTGGFINSGLVELLLPAPVAEEWLDPNGIFWLSAQFEGELIRQVSIEGIYTNVVEAVLDTHTVGEDWDWQGKLQIGTVSKAVKNIPGLTGISQITAGKGGRREENQDALKNRMVHRIKHRNRLVTPFDFEDMVLEHFPQVAKVKCLAGLDSKGRNRTGMVTLVVIPRSDGNRMLPLCTHELLSEIERFLEPLTGAFVQVDAVNPLYEEMKVRCSIGIEPGWSAAETILRLKKSIEELIAPWKNKGGVPVFGYRFALQELKNRIMEDMGVSVLYGLSVLQVCSEGEKLYRLKEVGDQINGDEEIGASCVWGIPIPASDHLIRTDQEGEWQAKVGIGDIGVGETFVVG